MSFRALPRGFALLLFTLLLSISAAAQQAQTKAQALRPPPGEAVAIIAFEDMQCPDCARAHPLLQEAAKRYNIPMVHRDFPLPMHNWAFEAAVISRYFESRSKELGAAWRDFVYRNQAQITPQNLKQFATRFAQQNGTAMPFILDPKGELAAKVKADFALGQRIGVQHTPTIFVVNNSDSAQPFVEVVDRNQLFAHIEQMQKTARPVTAATQKKKTPAKTAPKSQ